MNEGNENKEQEQPEVDNTTLSDYVNGSPKEDTKEPEQNNEQVEQETQANDAAETQESQELEENQEPELSEEEKSEIAKKKQEEYYRKRQEEKEARIAQQPAYEQSSQSTQTQAKEEKDEELEYLRELARQQKLSQAIGAAEKELIELEKPFKEAFSDYEDKVNQALSLTKKRLMSQGMTETEADSYLRREKVLLADRAAAQGHDPVEAVYKEAQAIVSTFEAFAEENGYVKVDGKKTKMQAVREMSKPNAMAGGSNASAVKRTVDDLGDEDLDEIKSMSLADFM